MNITLAPHQIEAAQWLRDRAHGRILADDVGLGKTYSVLAAARHHAPGVGIVVCPKRVVGGPAQTRGWYYSLLTCGRGLVSDDVIIYDPNKPQMAKATTSVELSLDCKWFIVSYERLEAFRLQLTALKIPVREMIVDEAHNFINNSARRKSLWKLATIVRKDRAPIYLLTATPIRKSEADLWALLKLIKPSTEGQWEWQKRWFKYEWKRVNGVRIRALELLGLRDKEAFEKFHGTYLLRRTAEQVGWDQRIEREVISVTMRGKQKKAYDEVAKHYVTNYGGQLILSGDALTTYMRLRQISIAPDIVHGASGDIEGVKLEELEDIIRENWEDTKIVIWTSFVNAAQSLCMKWGMEYGIRAFLPSTKLPMYGDQAIDAFLNNPDVRVLVSTPSALGEGVDGLQHVSSLMVFLDRDPSLITNIQAEGRLPRPGQKRVVRVIDIVASDTDRRTTSLITAKVDALRTINDIGERTAAMVQAQAELNEEVSCVTLQS